MRPYAMPCYEVLPDGAIRPRRVTATLTAPERVPAPLLKNLADCHDHGLCGSPDLPTANCPTCRYCNDLNLSLRDAGADVEVPSIA